MKWLLDFRDKLKTIGHWFFDTGEDIATVWWVGPALAAPFMWVATKFWDCAFYVNVGYSVLMDLADDVDDLIDDIKDFLSWPKIVQKIGFEFPGIWDFFYDPGGWITGKLIDKYKPPGYIVDTLWDLIVALLCYYTGLETGFFHDPLNWILTQLVRYTPITWEFLLYPADWITRQLIDAYLPPGYLADTIWDLIIALLCNYTGLQTGFFHNPLNWIQTQFVRYTPLTWEFFLYPDQFIIHQLCDWTGLDISFFDDPVEWVFFALLSYLQTFVWRVWPIVQRVGERVLFVIWEGGVK